MWHIDNTFFVTYDDKKGRYNFMKYSDVELIDLVKQGDEAAFEELYQRFHKLAYFFANKMCKNDADAKDVVSQF